MLVKLVSGVAAAMLAVPLAHAGDRPRDQQRLMRVAAQRSQENLPAREIVRRVTPLMGDAQYLGFLYDPATNIYTLKFLRKSGAVIWVDVDARTGKIVRRVGG